MACFYFDIEVSFNCSFTIDQCHNILSSVIQRYTKVKHENAEVENVELS